MTHAHPGPTCAVFDPTVPDTVGQIRASLPLASRRGVRLRVGQGSIEQAIKLISAGQVPAQRLVTRTFPLGQAEVAFRAAAQGIDGEPGVKIQLEPQR